MKAIVRSNHKKSSRVKAVGREQKQLVREQKQSLESLSNRQRAEAIGKRAEAIVREFEQSSESRSNR